MAYIFRLTMAYIFRLTHSVRIKNLCTMEEDSTANQRSAFSLSLTLALYISYGFGLSWAQKDGILAFISDYACQMINFLIYSSLVTNARIT